MRLEQPHNLIDLLITGANVADPHMMVVEDATTSVDSNLGHHHVRFEAGGVDLHIMHLQTVAPQPISRNLTAYSAWYVIEWVILHSIVIVDSIRHIP
jgi:hypothetical protein